MHKSIILRLTWAAVALATALPILSACASPSVSGRQKVQSKVLPGTNRHRIVRVPNSGPNAGPENIVNPRRRYSQQTDSNPHSQQ